MLSEYEFDYSKAKPNRFAECYYEVQGVKIITNDLGECVAEADSTSNDSSE